MSQITSTVIYGLEESIVASGFPMLTELPSPSEFKEAIVTVQKELVDFKESKNKDIRRALKLGSTKTGEGHDNFLNGIIVQFNWEIPIKMWTEAERYHFLDFVSSSSTMHRISQFDFSVAYDESVDPRIVEIMKELQENYLKTNSKEDYLKALMSNPTGMNIFARMTTNYRQLKTIYNQRKTHRLPQWREFCEWCLTLPYFTEITGVENGKS